MLYHRCGEGKHANAKQMLFSHLQYIKDHYSVVLPGDPLQRFTSSVCLTFDDATYDFYYAVFPMLQKLNLRALLAVPVKYILEKTSMPSHERLAVPYSVAMQEGIYKEKAPFCTFEELKQMCESGHVEIASHSYSHPNLTYPFLDHEQEIEKSKKILEQYLPQEVSSFVYPFGRFNGKIHAAIAKHYPYIFRIGSRMNFSWNAAFSPLSRIPADNLVSPEAPFSFKKKTIYLMRSCF